MRIASWAVVCLFSCVPVTVSAQTPAASPADPRPTLEVGGYIQHDYLAPIGDRGGTPDTFRFRRVRLTGNGWLTEHIGWAVSIEATGTPVLRDAYITLKYLPAATIRVGQIVMPFGQEQYVFSSNSMAFTERITNEVLASRDAGMLVSNDRPFFGWLSYGVGITNGTRQNNSDNNSAKDGIVRLTVEPPKVDGLAFSINAVKGEQPDGMRTRTGADLSFERRRFHVGAELDRERTGNGPRKEAGYVFGVWRLYPRAAQRGFHHLEFGARLGRTRHLETPRNQWDLAVNYYVTPTARFMSSLVLHRDRAEGEPRATFHARANIRF